jgi:hypothetical protein
MTQSEKKSIELFYTPPKDEYFEELRTLCIRFWEVFPELTMWNEKQERMEKEYAQSKIDLIKNLKNEGANFISMVQMIHQNSRQVLAKHLSLETRNEISMRLYGFENNEFDPFNIWNIDNNIHDT